MSEHLKRTIELQQSGEKSVHMQALEDRMEKLSSGQSLSVHMQAIAERVEQGCERRSYSIHMQATLAKAKEPPLHTTHPVVVVRVKNPVVLSNQKDSSAPLLFSPEIDITRHHRHLANEGDRQ